MKYQRQKRRQRERYQEGHTQREGRREGGRQVLEDSLVLWGGQWGATADFQLHQLPPSPYPDLRALAHAVPCVEHPSPALPMANSFLAPGASSHIASSERFPHHSLALAPP